MIPLTHEENNSYKKQKVFCDNDNKKYHKVRYHSHFTGKYRESYS